MPNCKEHTRCDLVCRCLDGYYCNTEAHEWRWRHIPRLSLGEHPQHFVLDDMPDDIESYYNERAEEMP